MSLPVHVDPCRTCKGMGAAYDGDPVSAILGECRDCHGTGVQEWTATPVQDAEETIGVLEAAFTALVAVETPLRDTNYSPLISTAITQVGRRIAHLRGIPLDAEQKS